MKRTHPDTCRVPEKGKTWRSFVTSTPLKQAIARYAKTLRQVVPEDGDVYLFNPKNLRTPLCAGGFGDTLKSIANAAGVKDVNVHPHAFRHTIVGQLIDAGNPMELVSKFMGHASVSTTAVNYWAPTTLELHEKMNNPFTGQFQPGVQQTSQIKQELELLYNKPLALAKLHLRGLLRVSAANGVSAVEMERRYEDIVPNEEDLLRAILESTCSSISGEQPMPADQVKEDEAILAAADEQNSKGDCGSDEDEPERKRVRVIEKLGSEPPP